MLKILQISIIITATFAGVMTFLIIKVIGFIYGYKGRGFRIG